MPDTVARSLAGPSAEAAGPRVADISVVVLCYRAQAFVRVFVARLKEVLERRGLRYELVLVANYHPNAQEIDDTPAIVTEMAAQDPTIRAVTKPKEGMMGWDMRSGIDAAAGGSVVVIDGDGQMPAEDVLAVYEKLSEGGYDLVKTYRWKRYDGWVRSLVSVFYNVILKLMFPKVRVRDANSKPKIVTREALERLSLSANGWFIDAEMVIQASYRGLRIGEIPTVFYWNAQRSSFVRPRAVLEFAWELVRYRLSRRSGPLP